MKILAIDTSMAACSAAVHDGAGGGVLAQQWRAMERGHAEAIAPMVKAVMADARLRFADLDRIAVTTGPGTFTGVRIGLAMARGLGLALGVPVIGIDSLSAIAANEGATPGPFLVTADARNSEVYAALFESGKMLRPPAVVARTALDIPDGTRIAGTAADAVIAASGRGDVTRGRSGDLPVAVNFARLAVTRSLPRAMPAPLYLRKPDAKPQKISPRDVAPGIRQAAPQETLLLAMLHAECFDDPWTEHDFAELMAMNRTSALIAVEAAEPVGLLMMRGTADEAEILTMGIRPQARRRGVAKVLIEHAAALQGSGALFIEVARSNAAALALYESCGFVEAGLRPSYYNRGRGLCEDAIVMRKDLPT